MDDYTVLLRELIEGGIVTQETVLETLNNEEGDFKSFSESLRREINLKYPNEKSDEKDILKSCFKEKGIPFNRNTLNNWFDNRVPKKSDESREHMYKVAFALNMNINETIRLFVKVYKDRPFDLRRITEFIYYASITNRFDYNVAQQIISDISIANMQGGEHTQHTSKLFDVANMLKTKESITNYVINNYANFCTSNESAKRVLQSLIDDVIVKEEEKNLIKNKLITSKNSIMSQELMRKSELIRVNHNMSSISTMLNVIYGTYLTKLEEVGKNFLKNSKLPKEVIGRLPTKHSFSKADPTYEELRKMIILLSSYKYWILKQVNNDENYDFDDYQYEINGYLLDANLQDLYVGNSFDWLFLYCSSCAEEIEPIEIFRGIISDSIED